MRHTFWEVMNLARSHSPVLAAGVAALFFAACVNLTPHWSGQQDGGGQDRHVDSATASGDRGGISAVGPDAGGGGSGGSAATGGAGGTATGGTGPIATGGAAGSIVVDAGSAMDAAATGGTAGSGSGGAGGAPDAAATGGSGTGGAGGVVATDAGGVADAVAPQDVGADVPSSADTNLPSDFGIVAPDTAETRQSDGSTRDGRDGSGTGETGGTGDAPTDNAPAPTIVSIDFVGGEPNGSSAPSGTVVMGASESAGVKPATHWNSATGATGTLTSLMSASGSATTASVSWNVVAVDGQTDTWSNSFTDAPGDARMMNGYLDPRAIDFQATVSVTGLPDPVSSGYDVYVYCYSHTLLPDTLQYQYKIGTTTYSVTQTGPSASTFPGYTLAAGGDAGTAGAGNYVVFHNLTGSGFTLTALPRPSAMGTERAPVNGIQIVYPSGS